MNNRYMKGCKRKPVERDEDNNPLCRWCKNIVLPPKRTFCSPNCVHEYRIRTSSSYLRSCVYQRDKGICQICNCDTKKIAKEILNTTNEQEELEVRKKYNIHLKRKVLKKKNGGGLWDADHINCVKDGGGQCGLDNLRTLCISCHKERTKKSYKKKISE